MQPRRSLSAGFRLGPWTVTPEDGSLASGGRTARLEPLVIEEPFGIPAGIARQALEGVALSEEP